jgi:hypothetical protein
LTHRCTGIEKPQGLKARILACLSGTAEHLTEKLDYATSAAKAFADSTAFIAALKALRHPKPAFFRKRSKRYATQNEMQRRLFRSL